MGTIKKIEDLEKQQRKQTTVASGRGKKDGQPYELQKNWRVNFGLNKPHFDALTEWAHAEGFKVNDFARYLTLKRLKEKEAELEFTAS